MARIRQAGAVAYRNVKPEPLFLVVTSRRDPTKWIFPKGHIEPGEDAERCAVRELAEEAGVEGRLIKTLGTLSFRSGDEDVDVTYYLCEAKNEGEDREGRQRRWLTANEAAQLVSHDGARDLLMKAAKVSG